MGNFYVDFPFLRHTHKYMVASRLGGPGRLFSHTLSERNVRPSQSTYKTVKALDILEQDPSGMSINPLRQ